MKSEKKDTIAFDKKKKGDHKNRNIALTVGSVIILILSAITFIFIPAMTQGSTSSTLPAFGSYNKKAIKYESGTYFANMVSQYAESYQNNGNVLDASGYYSVFSEAFNATVLNFAATDEVEKSGYIVPDSLINRNILPYFYDTNGVYSEKIFNDTPDSTKTTLRTDASTNLIYQRYIEDFFGSSNISDTDAPANMYGLKTSTKELPFIQEMSKEKQAFVLASFPTANYPLEEAVSFGKENADLFNKYNLSVITIDTESQAKNVLSQINKGTLLFEDAVTEFSTKSYSNDSGVLSNSYKYQIKTITTNDEDLQTLTTLEPNQISGVIKTANNKYSIFRCDAAVTAPNFEDSAVANTVKSYMASYENGKIEDYYIGIANDFITAASVNGFEEACTSFGITKVDVPAFPINYNNSPLMSSVPSDSIADLSGASTNENFLKTVASLSLGETSSPIVLGSNVLVLKCTEETTAEDSTLTALNYMYPYYSVQNDQYAIQSFFLNSSKTKNDVLSVFLENFLN